MQTYLPSPHRFSCEACGRPATHEGLSADIDPMTGERTTYTAYMCHLHVRPHAGWRWRKIKEGDYEMDC